MKKVYVLRRGKLVPLTRRARQQKVAGGHLPGCWPMYSRAMGVNPSQIAESKAALEAQGVRAEFHEDGRIKLESKGHRKQVAEAIGLFDRNGGYGDPQPSDRHYELAKTRERAARARLASAHRFIERAGLRRA